MNALCMHQSMLGAARPRLNASRQSVLPRVRHTASTRGALHVRAVAEAEAPAPAPPAPPAAAKKAAKKDTLTPHCIRVAEELAKPPGERKIIVVSVAPAVRVAISEAFDLPPGAITIGQIITGLRLMGFEHVFDTLFAADLTIMEEGTELLTRLTQQREISATEKKPMFTSCCPGWVGMVEKMFPEIIPYLSSCKSPQMMMGSVIKNFFASEINVKPSDIMSVSIMPCTRKQEEADRPWQETEGSRDVDHVITTVELATMMKERGIDLTSLPEEAFESPLGIGSGGGQLFGTTGGVMEAALRTVVELVTGDVMSKVVYQDVRGLEGIKEATLNLKPAADGPFAKYDTDGTGLEIKVAVANGLGNAKKLVTELKAGNAKYDFVEVMACPAGCIGGGGQPRSTDKTILQKRQQAMYSLDERMVLRRPHDNPSIKMLYEKWLHAPNSHVAHHALHTHYMAGGPPDLAAPAAAAAPAAPAE